MYCAVLDDRVCDECASRDGEIYEFDDDEIPSVPRHNNCRCRLIPVADEDESNRKLAMPFREYLRSLPKAEQKKRLGAAKYDLLKSGRYQLKAYEPPNGGQRLSMAELKARNIGSGLHFRAVHTQKFYREKYRIAPGTLLPETDFNSERILSLPLFPDMTPEDVDDVVAAAKEVLAAAK